jgi:subtilisin
MFRRMPATFLGLPAVMALVLAAAPASAADSASGQERVDVIVVLHDSVADARAAARAVASDHDARIGHVYEHALEGFSASIPVQRRAGLEADRRVAYVNDDRPVHAFEEKVPTGVSRIDGSVAHGSATGSGVRVAVIDTGIDSDHEDLAGNLDLSNDLDCINSDTDAEDDQGHGTHVAGTIAAVDNDLGVIGVAPAATLVGIKVLDHRGSGSWESVICGIDHVTALNTDGISTNDVDVANMSLGGSGGLADGDTCTNNNDSLYAAICTAVGSGAVFTVAAGNDSKDASDFVPAAYPEVITVSAYQDTDGTTGDAGCSGFPWTVCDEEFASFSNYGDIVDVIAPGRNILSTTYDGAYGSKSGTSMAAPHVAGVAALVLQGQSSLAPADVEAHLRNTGQCPDDLQNGGTGDCTGQGTWKNDPDSWVEPMSHAAFAVGSTGETTGSAPTAGDSSVTLDEDTSAAITLSGSDAESCELGFTVSSGPSNGSLSAITGQACTSGSPNTDTATIGYVPNADYHGSDSFSFQITDGDGNTSPGTVTITVNPVNDAPVAGDDSASTTEGTSVTITVTGNDTDVDGDALTVTEKTTPSNGTVTINSDNTLTYTPNAGYTGPDSFGYTVSDGTVTDTANVAIEVTATASTMHVGDLDSVSANLGSKWQPAVSILVVDANGNAVTDATASGTWTHPDGSTEAGSCTTDATGRCTETSAKKFHKNVSSTTFTVDGVTDAALSLTYDQAGNNDADGDSDGTTITVTKP